MDQLKALPLGRKLILGAGVLLFIDTFLPWQSVSIFSQNAWHGFWGVLLGLMTIALVLWVGARAFGVALPAAVPDGLATLVLGGLIVLFALVKALNDSYTAWAAWVGVVLGAAIAYGAWLTFQESGESLPRVAAATAGAPAASAPDTGADDAPAPPSGADAT
jgi:hypothetical protein